LLKVATPVPWNDDYSRGL